MTQFGLINFHKGNLQKLEYYLFSPACEVRLFFKGFVNCSG